MLGRERFLSFSIPFLCTLRSGVKLRTIALLGKERNWNLSGILQGVDTRDREVKGDQKSVFLEAREPKLELEQPWGSSESCLLPSDVSITGLNSFLLNGPSRGPHPPASARLVGSPEELCGQTLGPGGAPASSSSRQVWLLFKPGRGLKGVLRMSTSQKSTWACFI